MYAKLNKILSESDGVLLTSPHNMRYFSGFSGGEGAIWISENQKIIFTDSRYTEAAEKETVEFEIRETNNWQDSLKNLVAKTGAKTIAFEDRGMSAADYLSLQKLLGELKMVANSSAINTLRMVKEQRELDIMAEAEAICERAYERILTFLAPGISEKELAAELEYYVKQEGGEGLAFDTIAISGENCSLPHGVPTDKKIQKGDFVTMDFGCVFKGYCSDMTRTVVVGKANPEQRRVYEAVRLAQQAGLDAIRCGITGKETDSVARCVIEEYGYGEYFRHSLGHGVGLVVHELPNLSPKSEIVLQENMVVTCEPGIYIPGFGGVRIEDMVCVKKDGILNFNHSPKELIEI